MDATAAGYSGGDMQSVAYFLAGSGSTLAQQLSGSGPSSLGQVSGLSRLQGDRMAMQAADESGDLSSMASGVKLLAPEVASISFEYFDGVSWTTTWDSRHFKQHSERGSDHDRLSAARRHWRLVLAAGEPLRRIDFNTPSRLPLAQPYLPEDSL